MLGLNETEDKGHPILCANTFALRGLDFCFAFPSSTIWTTHSLGALGLLAPESSPGFLLSFLPVLLYACSPLMAWFNLDASRWLWLCSLSLISTTNLSLQPYLGAVMPSFFSSKIIKDSCGEIEHRKRDFVWS